MAPKANLKSCAAVYTRYGSAVFQNNVIDAGGPCTNISGGPSNNVPVDPLYAGVDGLDDDVSTAEDNDWRLTVGSPESVKAGGLNGIDESFGFATDYHGEMRPASGSPWAMAALEP